MVGNKIDKRNRYGRAHCDKANWDRNPLHLLLSLEQPITAGGLEQGS
jgi:hypothetical protein